MYVARKQFKLSDRIAMPGDPIPEVDTWSYTVKCSHLKLGIIELRDDKTVTDTSCNKCGRKFKGLKGLAGHMKVHKGAKRGVVIQSREPVQ